MSNPLHHPRVKQVVLAWTCAAVILALLTLGIDFLLLPCLPKIDGRLFPVVRATGPVFGRFRDLDKACFSIPLVKVEPGIAIKDQFFVEASFRDTWLEPHEVDAYPAAVTNEPAPPEAWKTRPVGERWTKHWCFAIPQTVSTIQAMRVSGYAVHSRRPFFDTETPLPTFVIPAL